MIWNQRKRKTLHWIIGEKRDFTVQLSFLKNLTFHKSNSRFGLNSFAISICPITFCVVCLKFNFRRFVLSTRTAPFANKMLPFSCCWWSVMAQITSSSKILPCKHQLPLYLANSDVWSFGNYCKDSFCMLNDVTSWITSIRYTYLLLGHKKWKWC